LGSSAGSLRIASFQGLVAAKGTGGVGAGAVVEVVCREVVVEVVAERVDVVALELAEVDVDVGVVDDAVVEVVRDVEGGDVAVVVVVVVVGSALVVVDASVVVVVVVVGSEADVEVAVYVVYVADVVEVVVSGLRCLWRCPACVRARSAEWARWRDT
jgi:hypothetical protein